MISHVLKTVTLDDVANRTNGVEPNVFVTWKHPDDPMYVSPMLCTEDGWVDETLQYWSTAELLTFLMNGELRGGGPITTLEFVVVAPGPGTGLHPRVEVCG